MMLRNYRSRCRGLASHREGNLYLFTRIAKEPVVQNVHLHFTQIIFAFPNEFIISGRKLLIKEISGYSWSNNSEVVIFEAFQS